MIAKGRRVKISLVGNPNCGKSTLFNSLTGARQHVGNYPGVTVERVSGKRFFNDIEFEIVDLPGTYSLSATTEDEEITRNALVSDPPDLVVNVLDASNLERNLYLTLELLELKLPMILVLNMSDLAKSRRLMINIDRLSSQLGVPVLETVGSKQQSVLNILNVISKENNYQFLNSDRTGLITSGNLLHSGFETESGTENSISGEETVRATARYKRVTELFQDCVTQQSSGQVSQTDRLDRIFLHRVWGIPIFLVMMYLVFQLTFTLGQYPMAGIECGISALSEWITGWYSENPDSIFRSFMVDGVIAGVGGVLVFLPNILLLFLAIAFLEDSGYMARAAFLMNRLLTKMGLHGRSFIPMLLGFGCSVPAIMATRSLENRQARLTTMFIIPLMSCGARLPIYTLIIPAFFPPVWRAPVLWLVYLTGIVLSVFLAMILRKTIFKGGDLALILELPPYHCPMLRNVGSQTLRQGWMYLRKAGTIILSISVILWFLSSFPKLSPEAKEAFEARRQEVSALLQPKTEEDRAILAERLAEIDHEESEQALVSSWMGRLGKGMEPVLCPMGFDWRIGTALLGAMAAKEVFVAQMGIVCKVGETNDGTDSLQAVLANSYTPLTGICIIIFCLVGMPCMATFAVTAKESGSWRWAFFQWGLLTALAWLLTTVVHLIGLYFLM